MSRKSTWIAVAVAIAVVVVVVVLMASVWTGLGDTGMSAAGWAALVLGVVVTLALGIGLMALSSSAAGGVSTSRVVAEADGRALMIALFCTT